MHLFHALLVVEHYGLVVFTGQGGELGPLVVKAHLVLAHDVRDVVYCEALDIQFA